VTSRTNVPLYSKFLLLTTADETAALLGRRVWLKTLIDVRPGPATGQFQPAGRRRSEKGMTTMRKILAVAALIALALLIFAQFGPSIFLGG
jgi:hypothetical protein